MSNDYSTRKGLIIEKIERARSSVNGNPAFYLTFTDGTRSRTMADAGFAYGIENPEYRGVPLTVQYTRAGNIATVTIEGRK